MKQALPTHSQQVDVRPDDGTHVMLDTLVSFDHAADRRLQRRAMLSMWLAMLVMALGVPTHLGAFGGHQPLAHRPTGDVTLLAWLAWLLTTATIWQARELLVASWQPLRLGRLGETTPVLLGALAAYLLGMAGLGATLAGATHAVPHSFDVTAMALAWLLGGAAQRNDLRRRYVTMQEQLMLLGLSTPPRPIPDSNRSAAWTGWLAALLLSWAVLTVGFQVGAGQPPGAALMAGLAALGLGCPCALGIARSAAAAAGATSAAAAGWVVVDEAAFWTDSEGQVAEHTALRLGQPVPGSYDRIAGAVRRAAWLNGCWAVGLNLLVLPVALRGPVDPLLPAAIMLLAWALITLTSRSIGWWSGAGRAR